MQAPSLQHSSFLSTMQVYQLRATALTKVTGHRCLLLIDVESPPCRPLIRPTPTRPSLPAAVSNKQPQTSISLRQTGVRKSMGCIQRRAKQTSKWWKIRSLSIVLCALRNSQSTLVSEFMSKDTTADNQPHLDGTNALCKAARRVIRTSLGWTRTCALRIVEPKLRIIKRGSRGRNFRAIRT